MARKKINIIDADELYRIACENPTIDALLARFKKVREITGKFYGKDDKQAEYERALYYQYAVEHCLQDCIELMGYTPYMFNGVCATASARRAEERA